jgi:serine/threonine protein kinase
LREAGDFFSNANAFDDAQYSGRRPIVGTGHHFIVYASPFANIDNIPAILQVTGAEVYCIKSPNFTTSGEEEGFQREYYHTILQELRVLSIPALIENENIITLLGLDFQEDYDDYKLAWPVLLTEYATFGTLDAFQEDLGGLNPELARTLLLDVALGIQSLHECNIVHGDVKSENVLICGDPTRKMKHVAKISDFGLSVIDPAHDKEHYLPGCTFLWSAPEAGTSLSVQGMQQTDIYSFGLTVWRVASNTENPFIGLLLNGSEPGVISAAKQDPAFPSEIIKALAMPASHGSAMPFARQVIAATLSPIPTERNLEVTIRALGGEDRARHRSDSGASVTLQDDPAIILQTVRSSRFICVL